MNNNDYLTNGSIVELKKLTDKVMIVGIHQRIKGEKYDYIGCIHPYGYTNPDDFVVFNKDAIEKVIFEGYRDEETDDFFEDVNWLKENEKKDE